MDYTKFIDTIVEKYNYPNNVRRAIEITLPLMVKKFGPERMEDILSVFSDVKIFTIKELKQEEYDKIEKEMMEGVNPHIKSESEVNYGSTSVPGSIYSYNPVYDENMNVVDEKKWIVVQEINKYQAKGYQELFGTDINIPYFIHEASHALGMLKPTYRKEGNRIYSKHGMYESVDELVLDEEGYIKEVRVFDANILVEELVNEKSTQDMLCDFFGVDKYSEVNEKLKKIGHVSSNYGPTLMALAESLELALKPQNLMRWRIDNDTSVKDNFNTIASSTKIAGTFFPGEEPFNYLATKAHEMFLNKSNCYKIGLEEYRKRSLVSYLDAMAPICAYREGIGEKDFDFYANIRYANIPQEQKTTETENKAL